MAIQELVSIPFLVSIVITCVLVAAVSFLFYNKIQQQSAQISAIMDLTTTLVAEVNSIKSSEHVGIGSRGSVDNSQSNTLEEATGVMNDIHKVAMNVPFMTGAMDSLDPLIDVSEDEEGESSDEDESNTETSDDDDTDDDDDDDEDDNEDDDEDDDEDDAEDDDEDDDDNKPRVEELDSVDISETKLSNIADIDDAEALELKDNEDDLGIDITNLNFEKFAMDDIDDAEELTNVTDEEVGLKGESKVIEIGEQDVTDYSKYTVSELRKVAFTRGLIGDTDKPNKNKLIKMLSA